MMSYRIAVIFPSRGLAFSETCEELLNNLEGDLDGYDYEIYFSHGLPIPDCFNRPLEKALANPKNTHFWIVEDDMVLPKTTLASMLDAKTGAVAYDYPVTDKGVGAVQYDSQGKALFTGTGCLLLTRDFITKFKRPIFRDDIRWDVHLHPEGLELKKRVSKTETYGMHDVSFGLECYRKGRPIKVLKGNIGQRKLVAWGKQGTNKGQHNIKVWNKIKKQPDLISLTLNPQESTLIAVRLKSGEITNVSEETAQRLELEGKATRVRYKEVNFL